MSRKGIPHKRTAELRAMILSALTAEGGRKYLRKIAKEHPTAFCTLLGKVLPTQVTGPDDGPVRLEAVVTLAPEDAYKAMLG